MNSFLTNVVLATDGLEESDLAAWVAVDLCDRTGADLHVVHAWQNAPTALSAPVTALRSELPGEEAAGLLEGQVERIRAGGGTVKGAHLKKGPAAEEIVALAGELDADLVVMGTRGTGAMERLMLGSVSEEVARISPCPTLVVRGEWPPRNVVVGDDLSEEARRAGELAARIGVQFGASALLVLGFPSPAAYNHAEAYALASRVRVSEYMFGEGGEILRERAVRLETLLGKRPSIKVLAGDAATTIREAAGEREGPTLVAVGCRGLGALRRFALGSVSADVLRDARGPVIVFPSSADDEPPTGGQKAREARALPGG